MSVWQIPQASTLMSISPSRGSRNGTSSITKSPPLALKAACLYDFGKLIVHGVLVEVEKVGDNNGKIKPMSMTGGILESDYMFGTVFLRHFILIISTRIRSEYVFTVRHGLIPILVLLAGFR